MQLKMQIATSDATRVYRVVQAGACNARRKPPNALPSFRVSLSHPLHFRNFVAHAKNFADEFNASVFITTRFAACLALRFALACFARHRYRRRLVVLRRLVAFFFLRFDAQKFPLVRFSPAIFGPLRPGHRRLCARMVTVLHARAIMPTPAARLH